MSSSAPAKVTMIDYGIGNLRSVQKALQHVGANVQLTDDADAVRQAQKLILPGVGAFGAGMDALRRRGLVTSIKGAVANGKPLLGICLGMQLLFDVSEELGEHEGLGLIAGRVVRFAHDNLVVPHMGWNQIDHDGSHPLLQDVPDGAHAYFVHSYYCKPSASIVSIGSTQYGDRFASVVARDQIFGLQFHPEKSQHVGLQILKNYVNL